MTCYHPLPAWQHKANKNLIFKIPAVPKFFKPLKVPCGQCIGCRLERSRQWAVRCVHESKMHKDNCFITLTFNNESLFKRQNPMSLDVLDFQLFMKRLRKRCGNGIRFYHCGEYVPDTRRPHYHACIFGYDFPDRKFWKFSKSGEKLYRSKILESLWSDPDTGESYGFSSVGDVTFESAAYVARYICDKFTNKDKSLVKQHYQYMFGGNKFDMKPEYTTMSRRPGVGSTWYDKFKSDIFPADDVIVRGKHTRPTRYYDSKLEDEDKELFDRIKLCRVNNAKKNLENNTQERLSVREKVKSAALKLFKRSLE